MLTGSLISIYRLIHRILNTEVSFKKVYFFILSKLTGLKTRSYKLSLEEAEPKFNEQEITCPAPKIREMRPTYVLLRQKNIEYAVNFNPMNLLEVSPPNIQESPPIYTMIRWRHTDLSIFTQFRNYILGVFTQINVVIDTNFSLKTQLKLKKIDESLIELNRRLRITEEIIKISPYTHKAKRNTLYKIPVVKKPLAKSYFEDSQMDEFREILSKQAKTRKSNIEIASIYDKLNVEFYSSIKQDPDSKNLTCYLNSKLITPDNQTMYYLIVGNRKDTKEIVKSLVILD